MLKPTLEKSFALHVDQALAGHVVENFPQLVSFVRAYFDWMEQQGNVSNVLHNFEDTNTPDFIDEYYELIRREYLVYFPDETFIRRDLFIKAARALYASKGTVASIRTFFRAVFNEEINVTLPIERSIIPFNRPNINIFVVEPNASPARIAEINSLVGQWIKVQPTGARALVESIRQYNIGTNEVFEFTVSNVKNGVFGRNEIFSNVTEYGTPDVVISATTAGIITSADVLTGGSGYVVGEPIDVPAGTLSGATGQVASVDESGAILSVIVKSPGLGYTANQTITNLNGKGATVRFNVGGQYDASQGIFRSPTVGLYTYTIESSVPAKVWANIFRDAVHPAGVRFNSVVQSYNNVTEDSGTLSLKLYARSEPDGGVNYNNPRYISSREYFEPVIFVYKSNHLYDIARLNGVTFNDVFDIEKNIIQGSETYRYGNGTYGEFPAGYFDVDTQVRASQRGSFAFRERVAVQNVDKSNQYAYTNGLIVSYSLFQIEEIQNIYGDTQPGQLQFNLHYERGYVGDVGRLRNIYPNLPNQLDVEAAASPYNRTIRFVDMREPNPIRLLSMEQIADHQDRAIEDVWADLIISAISKESIANVVRYVSLADHPDTYYGGPALIGDYENITIQELDEIYSNGAQANKTYMRSQTSVQPL